MNKLARLRPGQPGYNPDMDSPEAVAGWRVRGIRDLNRRKAEYQRHLQELRAENRAAAAQEAQEAITPRPLMREDAIEAGSQSLYDDLQKRKATAKS